MNGPNPRSPWRAACWQLLVLTGMLALFIPTLGPLMDHHFVERQFHHDHLYLGQPDLEHIHYGDTPHSHHPGQPAPEDGIVYLNSDDGRHSSSAPLVSLSLQVSLLFSEPPDLLLLHGSWAARNVPHENYIPPTTPPPRT